MLEMRSMFSGFSVDNINDAKNFYTKVLGLTLESEEMGLQLKAPDGTMLFIYPKNDHEPATFTVLNFAVDDIDDAVDELTKQGVKFEHYDDLDGTPIEQDEKGILRSYGDDDGPDIAWFKDPAGNILSVIRQ